MTEGRESDMHGPERWSRFAMTIVRVALLVFLIWTLFSAKFASETPIAEDVPSTPQSSRAVDTPCPT